MPIVTITTKTNKKHTVHKIEIDDSLTTLTAAWFREQAKVKRTKIELITAVVIPKGVTQIASLTFQCFYSLSFCIMAHTVTRVGELAFNSCSMLRTVLAPEGLAIPLLPAETKVIRYPRASPELLLYARSFCKETIEAKNRIIPEARELLQNRLYSVFFNPEKDIELMLGNLKLLAKLHTRTKTSEADLGQAITAIEAFITTRYHCLFSRPSTTAAQFNQASKALRFLTKEIHHLPRFLVGPLFCQLMESSTPAPLFASSV